MYLMWCSPTASPHTHPRTVFFPASVGGFLSISRTLTFPLPFRAIVPAVIQPAIPAPTTTTSQFSAKFFTTFRRLSWTCEHALAFCLSTQYTWEISLISPPANRFFELERSPEDVI